MALDLDLDLSGLQSFEQADEGIRIYALDAKDYRTLSSVQTGSGFEGLKNNLFLSRVNPHRQIKELQEGNTIAEMLADVGRPSINSAMTSPVPGA